jgi:VanZ family protein
MAVGIAMAVAFFTAASLPAAGKIFTKSWHYAAHFAAFVVFAAAWALGLPRVPVVAVIACVVLFGFLHEWYEVLGHAHGFELADAIIDGIGAVVGAITARALLWRKARSSRDGHQDTKRLAKRT